MPKPQPLFRELEQEIAFPLEGVDLTRSFLKQRPGTCVAAQNVRSFEPATDRARGGQRAGMLKFFQNTVVGNFPIQDINALVVSSASLAGQASRAFLNSGANFAAVDPPGTPGQFIAAQASTGETLRKGTNGTSLSTSAGTKAFACSCWDGGANVYIAEVTTGTGAATITAYAPGGWPSGGTATALWSVALTVATGSLRNIAGMVASNNVLYIAYVTSSPTMRIIGLRTTDGTSIIGYTTGGQPAPVWANGSINGLGTVAVTNLAFSTAAVNCLAVCGSKLGVESQGLFQILDLTNPNLSPITVSYPGTSSTAKRTRVVSDGVATFYVLTSTSTKRIVQITAAGTLGWSSTLVDSTGGNDLCYDGSNTNKLVAVAAGAPSFQILNIGTGADQGHLSPASITSWGVIDSDGQGNFTLWRNAVASNDIMGVNNAGSTVWGPSNIANTTHTGASVNKTPAVIAGSNTITITAPGNQTSMVSQSLVLRIQATDSAPSGQTLAYSSSTLPTGLSIDAVTGFISGTPSTTSGSPFSVTVTVAETGPNSTGATNNVSFTWTINAASGDIITINNPVAKTNAVADTVSLQLTATDSGAVLVTFTVPTTGPGVLPPGLKMDSTGKITGSPTTTGTYHPIITGADNTNASAQITFTWTIGAVGSSTANTITVTNPGAQTTAVNGGVSLQVQATDSQVTPTTLTYAAQNLPPGLTLNQLTGVISGSPTTAGTSNVILTASDTTGASGGTSFTWNVVGGGPVGAVTRAVIGLVVSNGELRTFNQNGASELTGGPNAFHPTHPVVWSSPAFTQMFYVDGHSYQLYDANTNLVTPWVATSGTLPVDSGNLPATLIALWRGRLVLSGLPNDPANWFMSRALAPFDWDFSPEFTDTIQAVAGNSSNAGLIGDVITCILPYTDDTLIFGCTHSMWMLQGDPADGGQITNVSHTLGMPWGRPFTVDPFGQIYFMASDRGIYKLVPGALPVRVSQQIQSLLLPIDLSQNLIRMAWDMRNQGLAVYVTPYTAGLPAQHFFWESRTNSWWPTTFANAAHNPYAVYAFNSDDPGSEVLMLGGQDGYVRFLTHRATNDDGVPVASSITLGPITGRQLDEMLLKDLQATLGSTSGPVAFKVYVGNDPETALASSPVTSGTWSAGRNVRAQIRRAGFGIYVTLSATSPWTIERLNARYAPQGRIRQRRGA